jgi:hypothetical protein
MAHTHGHVAMCAPPMNLAVHIFYDARSGLLRFRVRHRAKAKPDSSMFRAAPSLRPVDPSRNEGRKKRGKEESEGHHQPPSRELGPKLRIGEHPARRVRSGLSQQCPVVQSPVSSASVCLLFAERRKGRKGKGGSRGKAPKRMQAEPRGIGGRSPPGFSAAGGFFCLLINCRGLERQTGQWNYRSNETQNARAFKPV